MSAYEDFVGKIGPAALVVEIPAARENCRAWVLVAKMAFFARPPKSAQILRIPV